MKKLLIVIVGLTMSAPIYAGTTMCAANDTVAVVLDPSIIATNSGSDATAGAWWAQFPFGRVSGTAAYINKTCSQGQIVPNLTDVDNNGNTKRVVGGEKYGKVCWCKMTHPAVSKWVCNTTAGSFGGDSFGNCLSLCALFLTNYYHSAALESGLFGSVKN